ncbi:MAG TPA: aldo/keto reductase [Planctomycetaceae bacterium]|nr:aldo/keto reductase [Planctomycetaceae bacterium]
MMTALRPVGETGLMVPPLGFGAFKIGRNQGIKYPQPYDLPDEDEVARLLNSVLDLGCTLIDTAPAYGLSEERIGRAIGTRRSEFVLSTKVGETFADGQSTFDFSRAGVEASLHRSLKRLRTDVLDVVFIHSNGDDDHILRQTDTAAVLQEWKARGAIRAIGLSGKTLQGARQAMSWADALMVEYHLDDTSHAEVMAEAARRNIAVFVKKGLASGRLPADEAIRFVLSNPAVTTLILGGLNFVHFQHNWQTAVAARSLP